MFFRRPKHRRTVEKHDYWVSYSDLMAGLLLAFILLLVGTLILSRESLEETQRSLEAREERLEEAEQELLEVNQDLNQVLGVRAALIRRLKEKFVATGSQVTFDDATGAIRLGSDILFDEGSRQLTSKGRRTLEQFMPLYFEALLGDPSLRRHVGQIVFEGHTNSNYSSNLTSAEGYLLNLELSQGRAYEAMEYVIERNIAAPYNARPLLAAIGYSSSRLRYLEGPERMEDKAASRRLEIRFRLKDEESLERIKTMLEKSGAQE